MACTCVLHRNSLLTEVFIGFRVDPKYPALNSVSKCVFPCGAKAWPWIRPSLFPALPSPSLPCTSPELHAHQDRHHFLSSSSMQLLQRPKPYITILKRTVQGCLCSNSIFTYKFCSMNLNLSHAHFLQGVGPGSQGWSQEGDESASVPQALSPTVNVVADRSSPENMAPEKGWQHDEVHLSLTRSYLFSPRAHWEISLLRGVAWKG